MIRVEWVVLKSRACFGNRRSNINETCLGLIQNLKEVLNQFSTKLQGHVYFNKQGERKGVITVGQMQGEDIIMFLCNADKNCNTASSESLRSRLGRVFDRKNFVTFASY